MGKDNFLALELKSPVLARITDIPIVHMQSIIIPNKFPNINCYDDIVN